MHVCTVCVGGGGGGGGACACPILWLCAGCRLHGNRPGRELFSTHK